MHTDEKFYQSDIYSKSFPPMMNPPADANIQKHK